MSERPDLGELDARIAVAYADGIPLEDTPTVLEDVAKAADEVLRYARALEAERDELRDVVRALVANDYDTAVWYNDDVGCCNGCQAAIVAEDWDAENSSLQGIHKPDCPVLRGQRLIGDAP